MYPASCLLFVLQSWTCVSKQSSLAALFVTVFNEDASYCCISMLFSKRSIWRYGGVCLTGSTVGYVFGQPKVSKNQMYRCQSLVALPVIFWGKIHWVTQSVVQNNDSWLLISSSSSTKIVSKSSSSCYSWDLLLSKFVFVSFVLHNVWMQGLCKNDVPFCHYLYSHSVISLYHVILGK